MQALVQASQRIVDTVRVFDTTRILDTIPVFDTTFVFDTLTVRDTLGVVLPDDSFSIAQAVQLVISIVAVVASVLSATAADKAAKAAQASVKAIDSQLALAREQHAATVDEAQERRKIASSQSSQLATALSQRVNALITEYNAVNHDAVGALGWLQDYANRMEALDPLFREVLQRAAAASSRQEDFARQAHHHYSNALASCSVIVAISVAAGLGPRSKPHDPTSIIRTFGQYHKHLEAAYEALAELTQS